GQHRQPATSWQAADAEERRQVEQVVDVVPTQNTEALQQCLMLRVVTSVATCVSPSGPARGFRAANLGQHDWLSQGYRLGCNALQPPRITHALNKCDHHADVRLVEQILHKV